MLHKPPIDRLIIPFAAAQGTENDHADPIEGPALALRCTINFIITIFVVHVFLLASH